MIRLIIWNMLAFNKYHITKIIKFLESPFPCSVKTRSFFIYLVLDLFFCCSGNDSRRVETALLSHAWGSFHWRNVVYLKKVGCPRASSQATVWWQVHEWGWFPKVSLILIYTLCLWAIAFLCRHACTHVCLEACMFSLALSIFLQLSHLAAVCHHWTHISYDTSRNGIWQVVAQVYTSILQQQTSAMTRHIPFLWV